MVADAGTFETWDNDLKTEKSLEFPGKTKKKMRNTGKNRVKRRCNHGKLYNQRREKKQFLCDSMPVS